jgi:hypothetical protein
VDGKEVTEWTEIDEFERHIGGYDNTAAISLALAVLRKVVDKVGL